MVKIMSYRDLIDTLWNVKALHRLIVFRCEIDLIDTLWNVKGVRLDNLTVNF